LETKQPAKQAFEELPDTNVRFTGTQVNYYFVCKRKLWLLTHNMELESESDLVHLGRLLHEHSYKRKLKEVQVDRIKVDFLQRDESRAPSTTYNETHNTKIQIDRKVHGSPSLVIHEIKRSKSMHDAHVFQLLYYMYYLNRNYGTNVRRGLLHYPLLKVNVPVELTEERENNVEHVIAEISKTVSLPNPPKAVCIKPCRSCAYAEMCWG
jgi:CRISPR-associated exonuclease Cas4